MIKIKHFMDHVDKDDGQRIWVEPIGLTSDFRGWCKVDQVMTQYGPPRQLWDWYQDHPEAYEFFRAQYHDHLVRGPHRQALINLIMTAKRHNVTLLHQSEDAQRNTATALYEFLAELEAYCPKE